VGTQSIYPARQIEPGCGGDRHGAEEHLEAGVEYGGVHAELTAVGQERFRDSDSPEGLAIAAEELLHILEGGPVLQPQLAQPGIPVGRSSFPWTAGKELREVWVLQHRAGPGPMTGAAGAAGPGAIGLPGVYGKGVRTALEDQLDRPRLGVIQKQRLVKFDSSEDCRPVTWLLLGGGPRHLQVGGAREHRLPLDTVVGEPDMLSVQVDPTVPGLVLQGRQDRLSQQRMNRLAEQAVTTAA
jgi:hypothetical protein